MRRGNFVVLSFFLQIFTIFVGNCLPGQGTVTISNDGATIMNLLDVVHPAAKTLGDIAQSQDSEVGDGTTTVVLLAGEILREAKPFVEDGVHPMAIIRAYRQASTLAVEKLKELQVMITHLWIPC